MALEYLLFWLPLAAWLGLDQSWAAYLVAAITVLYAISALLSFFEDGVKPRKYRPLETISDLLAVGVLLWAGHYLLMAGYLLASISHHGGIYRQRFRRPHAVTGASRPKPQ